MREVMRRVGLSARAWTAWTALLLCVSAFAIAVGITGFVSMARYIPFLALTSLAIARLGGGFAAYGCERGQSELPSGWRMSMIGGCASLVFLLSVLFWLGLEKGSALFGDSVAFRQVNDIVMLLSASISIICWYCFSLGCSTGASHGAQRLKLLWVLLVSIIGVWVLEFAYFLWRVGAAHSADLARPIIGGLSGIAAVLLSIEVMKGGSSLWGREALRVGSRREAAGAPCDYYGALRSLEHVRLSDRELMVLSFTLRGESARTIGERLGVSVPTVGSYRQRGYRKMGVSGKNELADLVLQREGSDDRRATGAASVDCPCKGELKRADTDSSPVEGGAGALKGKDVIGKIAMAVTVLCLVPLCFFGPVHHVLQAVWANDLLFHYADYIKCWGTGFLVISAMVLVARGIKKEGPSLFSVVEGNGPSAIGFITVCVGVACSAALVGESFYSLPAGGVWGLIGLVGAFACIGLSGEAPGARGISLFRHAVETVYSRYPETLLLFSASIPLADELSSALLLISIDIYPSVIGVYRLGVVALLVYAVVRLHSNVHDEGLTPSKYERLRHLLLGHGLTESQAEVIILSLRGQSTASICAKLLLAPGTVSSYRARTYARYGVCDLKGLREAIELEMQPFCKLNKNACSDDQMA